MTAAGRYTGNSKFREAFTKYVNESSAVVKMLDNHVLWIEFHGRLAAIPSLKNSKMPGRNFTDPAIMGRIKAMDHWFTRAIFDQQIDYAFGNEPLSVILICGRRSRSFDPDNCMSTVKDWLEPASKLVGRKHYPRGWGIGVTDDDALITGAPVPSSLTGIEVEHTTIIVRPLADVREHWVTFLAKHAM